MYIYIFILLTITDIVSIFESMFSIFNNKLQIIIKLKVITYKKGVINL